MDERPNTGDLVTGDVLPMRDIRVVTSTGQASYRAPSGRQFVVLLLGDESIDDSDKLDPEKALNEFGWERPGASPSQG